MERNRRDTEVSWELWLESEPIGGLNGDLVFNILRGLLSYGI